MYNEGEAKTGVDGGYSILARISFAYLRLKGSVMSDFRK